MVRFINNELLVPRGDNGVATIKLIQSDGTPFRMSGRFKRPLFVFSVAKNDHELKLLDKTVIEKYLFIGDYFLDGAEEGGFDIHIYSYEYDDPALRHIYQKPSGEFVYFKDVEGVLTEEDYNYVLEITIDRDDTKDLTAGKYRYNISLLDISSDVDIETITVEQIVESITYKDDSVGTNNFVVEVSAYV